MLSDHPHSRLSTSLTVFFTIKCTKNIASKSIEQWSFFFWERQLCLYNQSPTNVVHKIWPNQRTLHSSIMIRNWSVRLCLKDWSRHHSFTFLHPYISTNIQIVIQLNAHLHNSLFFGNTKQMMHTAAQKTLSKVACCLISIVPLTSYQYCSQQYGNP